MDVLQCEIELNLECSILLRLLSGERQPPPPCVHFQGRRFPSRMGFGRDGNLHVMRE